MMLTNVLTTVALLSTLTLMKNKVDFLILEQDLFVQILYQMHLTFLNLKLIFDIQIILLFLKKVAAFFRKLKSTEQYSG